MRVIWYRFWPSCSEYNNVYKGTCLSVLPLILFFFPLFLLPSLPPFLPTFLLSFFSFSSPTPYLPLFLSLFSRCYACSFINTALSCVTPKCLLAEQSNLKQSRCKCTWSLRGAHKKLGVKRSVQLCDCVLFALLSFSLSIK